MIKKITIIGGGNIGTAIALGLLRSGVCKAASISVTRRNSILLKELSDLGINTGSDNLAAVKKADMILLAVRPLQLSKILVEIREEIKSKILVSVIPDFTISAIKDITGKEVSVVRAMPNLAISVGESMTCLAAAPDGNYQLEEVKKIFEKTGKTLIVDESLIPAATVLSACGIAFFLRIIRAVSQGGIQIGFHAKEAQVIAAQTAKGATSLLFDSGNHPEAEIDKVTTPRGITIAGLNEMEHHGLNSALIKGILTSYKQINSK